MSADILAGAALLLTVNAVFWTALWLALRWKEERHARLHHVCWIDDTLCADCANVHEPVRRADS